MRGFSGKWARTYERTDGQTEVNPKVYRLRRETKKGGGVQLCMNNRFIWDLGKEAIQLTLKLWQAASAAVPEIFWENIKKFCPVNEKASVTDFLYMPWDIFVPKRDIKCSAISRVEFRHTTMPSTNGRNQLFKHFPQVKDAISFSPPLL